MFRFFQSRTWQFLGATTYKPVGRTIGFGVKTAVFLFIKLPFKHIIWEAPKALIEAAVGKRSLKVEANKSLEAAGNWIEQIPERIPDRIVPRMARFALDEWSKKASFNITKPLHFIEDIADVVVRTG